MRPSLKLLVTLIAASMVVEGCALFKATSRPAEDLRVQASPAQVARGQYLANHQMACIGCHSPLQPGTFMPEAGKVGAGGRVFGHAAGLPGTIVSSNLTSDVETGLGGWTDGEIIRAMREGVSKDGHALFPIMPYPNYREMSDEDAQAIVAYLRTLAPVKNKVAERQLDFPLNLIVNTIPQPVTGKVPQPPADQVKRGAYVAKMSSCAECHTPMAGGGPDMSKYLAGGHRFKEHDVPDGILMPNITQDQEHGIGKWTDAQIENAIRYGLRPDGRMLNPHMPWQAYNGMSKEDMAALVAYLRTVPAIQTVQKK